MDSAGGTTDLATIGTRASSVGVATLFRGHQTGRRVVGENNDNCAGSANDPIDRPRTDVKSNTARMKPCRRSEIRSGP